MLTRRKWTASCHDPHGSADNLGRNRSPSGVSQGLVWRFRRRDDTRLSTLYGFPDRPPGAEGADMDVCRRGQSVYAVTVKIIAGHQHGTFRGTPLWIIPAQRALSVRFLVSSVQLARSVHGAVLLVNGRSAVRSRSPAPRSEGVNALCVFGSWNECCWLLCLAALPRRP